MRGGGGKEDGGGSMSNESVKRKARGTLVGASSTGNREGFWAVTEEFLKSLEEKACISETDDVSTVGPETLTFEFISKTGGPESKILLSVESVVESRTISVTEKKFVNTGFKGFKVYTVFSKVFESELSILKSFFWISVYHTTVEVVPGRKLSFTVCVNSFQNKQHNFEVKKQERQSKINKRDTIMERSKIYDDKLYSIRKS